MTIETARNEAARLLRDEKRWLVTIRAEGDAVWAHPDRDDPHAWSIDITNAVDALLAAERRATVQRIQKAVLFQRNRLGKPPESIRVVDLLAILDEEAR